jgi:hypothetical protein
MGNGALKPGIISGWYLKETGRIKQWKRKEMMSEIQWP